MLLFIYVYIYIYTFLFHIYIYIYNEHRKMWMHDKTLNPRLLNYGFEVWNGAGWIQDCEQIVILKVKTGVTWMLRTCSLTPWFYPPD